MRTFGPFGSFGAFEACRSVRRVQGVALGMVMALAGALPGVAHAAPSPCRQAALTTAPGLVTGTVDSMRRLSSRETLGILALGGAAALGAHSGDRQATEALSSPRPLRTAFRSGAVLGSAPFELTAAFATYAIGRAIDKPCAVSVGADLFQAQLMSQVFTSGLKSLTRRSRPEGTGFSFPSGHTTMAFASATVLQRHFGWKVGIPAYAAASYVAASRVQMKRHFASDVVFGAALGVVAGRTVTIGHNRFVASPLATRDTVGGTLTWAGRK